MKTEEERRKLREELRDLIIRKFQLSHKLAIKEVVELLNGIPELTGLAMEDLVFEGTDLVEDKTAGFVKITRLGKAQQTTVTTSTLVKAVKFLGSMKELGFDQVTITVQKGMALILGGKMIGIGIAPRGEEE